MPVNRYPEGQLAWFEPHCLRKQKIRFSPHLCWRLAGIKPNRNVQHRQSRTGLGVTDLLADR
jgi:hypothetical protein